MIQMKATTDHASGVIVCGIHPFAFLSVRVQSRW
jgi:hypothetical protein